MGNELLIWVFLFAMLGILGVFMAIAANRKVKGTKLIILRDLRNPSAPTKRYWAMYDSRKDDYIKLFSNIFRPMKNKITPPFDLSAYSYNKIIYAYQGVSGHPEDDNIVPLHLPMVSQAGAMDYSGEVSGAISRTLEMKKEIDSMGFKVHDIVDYKNNKMTIDNINYSGILLGSDKTVTVKNKDNTISTTMQREHILISELAEIKALKLFSTTDKSITANILSYFGPDWVMQNLGIVPVEDVNVVLNSEKSAVASFNSKVNERVASKQSWFARNQILVQFIIMVMVFAIAFAIIIYATQSYVSSVGNNIQNSATTFIGKLTALGQSSGVLPQPTTTVPVNSTPAP